MDSKNYFERIKNADISPVLKEPSPLSDAPYLSKRLGNRVFLKREDVLSVFSFKIRGAYYKLSHLSAAEKEAGVVAVSAGNHAQGVALAARQLNISAVIVMPLTTPTIKVDAVRRYGAKVVLHGDTYDEASQKATILSVGEKMTLIHPFDDPDIIVGQGTVGREIGEQCGSEPPYAVFVPVGGGGLIAGISVYLKQLFPEVKIIGVEPEDSPTLHQTLKKKKRIKLGQVGLFADAVAVSQIGNAVFPLVSQFVGENDVVLVKTDEICAAIRDVFEDTRALLEPSGALAVAGMKKYVAEKKIQRKKLVAIASGANINFDRLKHVVERAEIGDNRECLLAVKIPERPGSFLKFCRVIGRRMVTEFNYRYADSKQAEVFAGIRFQDAKREKKEVRDNLERHGFAVLDLSANEMAKLHLRHMVGGRASPMPEEQLFRLVFPERPGALLEFLEKIGCRWNISLFHYRNHGAAYGRVLLGLQAPREEVKELEELFKRLKYKYVQESENPAYPLFLLNGSRQ